MTAAQRTAGLAIGVAFGVVLCWSGMANPAVIREALLFEDSYLFLFMASAVGTAALGQALLRRSGRRALLTGQRIAWRAERPQRRHVVGSLVFGVGWGVANVCPGPIAAQVGQGMAWGAVTMVGVVLGVWAFLRQDTGETEPAAEPPAVTIAA